MKPRIGSRLAGHPETPFEDVERRAFEKILCVVGFHPNSQVRDLRDRLASIWVEIGDRIRSEIEENIIWSSDD